MDIERTLGKVFNVKVTNVPELEHPIAVVLDYSPSDLDRPLSLAFGLASERKCWLTASKVQQIDGVGPNSHPDYRQFDYAERQFYPYSIEPLPTETFDCVSKLNAICRRLYDHVVWK